VRPLVGDEPLKDVVEALLIALQASAGQSAFSPADS
jgi:hypothetical protein